MQVIDSHTEGEPTRVVIAGGPDLGGGPISRQLERLASRFDHIRSRLILEPRGNDAMVGALLCKSQREDCETAVIYFNNRGYLGMCGHGTIGVVVTLGHLGRIVPGKVSIETPVGVVTALLQDMNTVTVENVASYCYRQDVTVDVPGVGLITGDIAWGGNWFFLSHDTPFDIHMKNEPQLNAAARRVKDALEQSRITGPDGAEIDHIEFFSDAAGSNANSKNYVLCPGGAYDRSPCGTGTSAKLACLAARGQLAEGAPWVQESIIGSRFTASYRWLDSARVTVSITGQAFVCSESRIIANPDDPFADGIPQ